MSGRHCVDCRFHVFRRHPYNEEMERFNARRPSFWDFLKWPPPYPEDDAPDDHRCVGATLNRVTGKPNEHGCGFNRGPYGYCGDGGALFQPKESQ